MHIQAKRAHRCLLSLALLAFVLLNTSPAQATPLLQQDPAKALFDRAMVKLNAEAYAEAIPLFRQLVNQYPNSEWADYALVGLGISYFAQKDYEHAIEAYQKVLDNYPLSVWGDDALYSIGVCYVQTGNLERARAVLQKLIKDYPNSEYAEQAKQVLQLIDSTQAPAPTPAANAGCDALKQEGMSLYRQAKYRLALPKYQEALACYQKAGDHKSEGAALDNIGVIYTRLGQYPDALKWYQDALAVVREIGDRAGEGATVNNIGSIYDQSTGKVDIATLGVTKSLDHAF